VADWTAWEASRRPEEVAAARRALQRVGRGLPPGEVAQTRAPASAVPRAAPRAALPAPPPPASERLSPGRVAALFVVFVTAQLALALWMGWL